MAKLLGQFLLLWKKYSWGAEMLPYRHEPSRKSDGTDYRVGDDYALPDKTEAQVACVLDDDLGAGNGLLTALLSQRTNATSEPKRECDAAAALSRILQCVYNQGSRDADECAKKGIEALKAEHEKATAKLERDKADLLATIRALQDAVNVAREPQTVMPDVFREIVAGFVGRSSKRRKMLAHGLGVSLPTVDRWVSGENAPHEVMRPAVVEFIHQHKCEHSK